MPYLGVRPADITSAAEAEVAGDLTVDTNTLKVDATNNRVGVGTASPTEPFHIVGASGAATDMQIQGGDDTNSVRLFMGGNTNPLHGRIVYSTASDFMAFSTGGDQRVRVDSDGLKFGSDTAAANALDDYEEGTWTVTNKSVASLSITNTQTAYYVKIGRLVFFNFYITYPSTSDSNTAKLSLPFASGVSTSQGHSYVTGRFQGTASNGIVGQITNGTDEILFASNTSSSAFFTNANFSAKYLLMSGCYRASA